MKLKTVSQTVVHLLFIFTLAYYFINEKKTTFILLEPQGSVERK